MGLAQPPEAPAAPPPNTARRTSPPPGRRARTGRGRRRLGRPAAAGRVRSGYFRCRDFAP
eukprot:scaffold8469_cov112-Isochrysis_galbana.AAC.1